MDKRFTLPCHVKGESVPVGVWEDEEGRRNQFIVALRIYNVDVYYK